jgi:hypothetical protein
VSIRFKRDDLGRYCVTVNDLLVAQLDEAQTYDAYLTGGISGWWRSCNDWKLKHPAENVIELISPHGSFSFTIFMDADGRLVLRDEDGTEHRQPSRQAAKSVKIE